MKIIYYFSLTTLLLLIKNNNVWGQDSIPIYCYSAKIYSTQYLFRPDKSGFYLGGASAGAIHEGLTLSRISIAFQIQNKHKHIHEIEIRDIVWQKSDGLTDHNVVYTKDSLYNGWKETNMGISVKYGYILPFFTHIKPESKWLFSVGCNANPYFYLKTQLSQPETIYNYPSNGDTTTYGGNSRYRYVNKGLNIFATPMLSYSGKGILFAEISLPISIVDFTFYSNDSYNLDTKKENKGSTKRTTYFPSLYALRLGLGIKIK